MENSFRINQKFNKLIVEGIIGCAPSHELLSRWNKRESDLTKQCIHTHNQTNVLANLPIEKGAYLGRLKYEDNKNKWKQIANEGARTIPPREHGGIMILKIFLEVHVFIYLFMSMVPN
jgi:formamidase